MFFCFMSSLTCENESKKISDNKFAVRKRDSKSDYIFEFTTSAMLGLQHAAPVFL